MDIRCTKSKDQNLEISQLKNPKVFSTNQNIAVEMGLHN